MAKATIDVSEAIRNITVVARVNHVKLEKIGRGNSARRNNMNWTETREKLLSYGIATERLPEAWEWRINLSGADLRGAYLRGADLSGAYLSGAAINWQSHDLIAEILRRAAGQNVQRRMLVGLILISRDWCWEKFMALELDPDLREWALAELRQWVKDDDGAPEALGDGRGRPDTSRVAAHTDSTDRTFEGGI